MILEKTVDNDVDLSIIGCNSSIDLDSEIHLLAFVRLSNSILLKTALFFLGKNKALSYGSFKSTSSVKDRLFILTFQNSKSVLNTLSQRQWFNLFRRFSWVSVYIAGLLKSLNTGNTIPKKGMSIMAYSFVSEQANEIFKQFKDIAALFDVFVSFEGNKAALLGYRLLSKKWKSIPFPVDNVFIISAFEEEQLEALCQSSEFKQFCLVTEVNKIGQFHN